ncbi:MAG: Zn-dependent hydrolase, glyoxylase [Planctomycetota bacterium]|nr:Zn-dependent hydrolase, glyoxylase [Planctomycetota bacterium]
MKSGTNLRIETIVSELFSQNAYVVWREGTASALIVDPGFDTDAIVSLVNHHHLDPLAILNTHGHADHIAGNARMKQAFPAAPLVIGRGDAPLLTDPQANLSAPFGMPITSPAADRLVDEGERLELAGFSFLVREIPGHSPGSVVFIADNETPPFVLSGDVLFSGSVGRTDFPGGSMKTLFQGIRDKLFLLPDAAVIYSGHGPTTTIGKEKRDNPYVGRDSDFALGGEG